MTLKFVLDSISGKFTAEMDKANKRIATAATSAIRQAADEAKSKSRASIAAGGFSSKWQNALHADVYPKTGVSNSPAAVVKMKIPYAEAFESGATIGGRPYLWLPLPNVPLGNGGKQLTPEKYVARIGKLVSVNNPGKPPMLFGQSFSIKRITDKKVTYQRGRKKANDAIGQWVPMFVGVPLAHDPKKFSIRDAIKAASDHVPEFYLKAFEATDG